MKTIQVVILMVAAQCLHAKRNVLMIMVDDLRPELGSYVGRDFPEGNKKIVTPNIDEFASHSLVLKRAFVQQAVCSPSRTSLLTSRRPDTTGVHDLVHYFRHVGGNFTTLPEYFKQRGYLTQGVGKIFHPGHASGHNDPPSWTEPYFMPDLSYWKRFYNESWREVNALEEAQHPLPDQQVASQALKALVNASSSSRRFFLAVGFYKPHLPFMAPEKFFKLYSNISLPKRKFAPVNLPSIAWSNFDELRKYDDTNGKFSDGAINGSQSVLLTRQLRRAYYASVSYIDSLIGQILSQLKKLPHLRDNTLLILMGDHGWQLGENGEWCKHSNMQLATRAPLIVSLNPFLQRGITSGALVEFIDIYPTVVELAGFEILPRCPRKAHASRLIDNCTEGTSFTGLFRSRPIDHKKVVFWQYPRMAMSGNIIMGYSARTKQFRYTEWVPFVDGRAQFKHIYHNFRELYALSVDPGETENVVYNKKYEHEQVKLAKMLRKYFI